MRVGVLGGGQLARMLALEGTPLGCRFTCLEPSSDPPAGVVAKIVRAPFDDPKGLARLADAADVVTYEFENVPAASADYLQSRLPVFPPPAALEASQDRLAEKQMFQNEGIATAPFHPVDRPEEVAAALAVTGLPAVVKTRRFGYDGKGQSVVESVSQATVAVTRMGPGLIVEGLVRFDRELSILAVAGRDGSRVFYPLTENHHLDGILRTSWAPAPGVTPQLQEEAEAMAGRIVDQLGYVGVLAVELFQAGGALLANEMAPRVHNSGHWTLDGDLATGGVASQFENHVRAVTGLPLAATVASSAGRTPGLAAMVNLIGAVPDLHALAAVPEARVHLYDKVPRRGRKLGHINIAGPDPAAVAEAVRQAWRLLPEAGPLPSPFGGPH